MLEFALKLTMHKVLGGDQTAFVLGCILLQPNTKTAATAHLFSNYASMNAFVVKAKNKNNVKALTLQ